MSLVERLDADVWVTERIEFILGRRGQLYTWLARPRHPRAVVVVCSPLFADFSANYHRERLLSRALLARGLAVARFHYYGEGNSDGDGSEMTFPSLCDDAQTVVEHTMRVLELDRVAFVGTRLGALVAATCAAGPSLAPLVLWEPVTDPARFFATAFRAKRMSEVAHQAVQTGTTWRDELNRHGSLDLLGYQIYPALVDSLDGVGLEALLGEKPPPMHVAWFQERSSANRAAPSKQVRLNGEGVETGRYVVAESWWFHNEKVSDAGELIEAAATWLSEATGDTA